MIKLTKCPLPSGKGIPAGASILGLIPLGHFIFMD